MTHTPIRYTPNPAAGSGYYRSCYLGAMYVPWQAVVVLCYRVEQRYGH